MVCRGYATLHSLAHNSNRHAVVVETLPIESRHLFFYTLCARVIRVCFAKKDSVPEFENGPTVHQRYKGHRLYRVLFDYMMPVTANNL